MTADKDSTPLLSESTRYERKKNFLCLWIGYLTVCLVSAVIVAYIAGYCWVNIETYEYAVDNYGNYNTTNCSIIGQHLEDFNASSNCFEGTRSIVRINSIRDENL